MLEKRKRKNNLKKKKRGGTKKSNYKKNDKQLADKKAIKKVEENKDKKDKIFSKLPNTLIIDIIKMAEDKKAEKNAKQLAELEERKKVARKKYEDDYRKLESEAGELYLDDEPVNDDGVNLYDEIYMSNPEDSDSDDY